ncbi:hypothetical protein [Natrononativus amylolyticus]|uniref:hypothetical protein n=1 Tax=Natrononativus amylolyticus TaxID=2963434 RepID=UPI0020CF2CB0|nr:hypothetical protein [Natrononativus amylolyticus]
MNRRTFVAAAGVGLTAATADCLSSADPSGGSGPSDDGDDADEEPADPTYTVSLEGGSLEDVGEFASLAVELVDPYVEPDSPAALEATLSNTTGATVAVSSGAPWPFGVVWADRTDDDGLDRERSITLWTDAYEESGHVGTDGKRVEGVNDIGLLEELEGGESITETFEIHEETPNLEAGTYEASLTCGIEPADGGDHEGLEVDLALAVEEGAGEPADGNGDEDEDVVPEDPRVDEPPYEIEVPEQPERGEEDDWNDHYLGEHMPAEPSLEFETLSGVRLAEPAISVREEADGRYAVHRIESAADRDASLDLEGVDEEVRDRLEAIDFDRHLLVVVESGFGSGSVHHRWKRVEAVDDGVHLHGYDTRPHVVTSDYRAHRSALLVERPADDDDDSLARVSLTINAETRVHVNSTEGAVTGDAGGE